MSPIRDILTTLITRDSVDPATGMDMEDTSPYGYVPTEYVAILFIVLFSLSSIAHLGQAVNARMWWPLWTICLCGGLEIAGWAGRLWSNQNVLSSSAFQLQIVATIIGPTPLLAAVFIIFGRLIRMMGLSYTRFSPRTYTIAFVSSDVVSLVIQGVGGGIAASGETQEETSRGANIMLGGISFQLVVIVVFSYIFGEYLYRYIRDLPFPSKNSLSASQRTSSPAKKLNIMTGTLIFVVLVLFIRAIYRVIELAGGWNGRVIETEVYFNVLDGAMVVLAMYALNFFHPSRLLKEAWEENALPPSMEELNTARGVAV